MFFSFARKIQKQLGLKIKSIKTDHGTEFENSNFIAFYDEFGIDHNFYAPRLLQKNAVVERNNRTLEDMTKTMLVASNLEKYFWAEAMNTACYIINKCMVSPLIEKTPYELL